MIYRRFMADSGNTAGENSGTFRAPVIQRKVTDPNRTFCPRIYQSYEVDFGGMKQNILTMSSGAA
jgi:hypothetical protein